MTTQNLSQTTTTILALLNNGRAGTRAFVEDTGGNCQAIVVRDTTAGDGPDYPEVLISDGDGRLPDDEQSILVTLYRHEDDEGTTVTVDPRQGTQAAATARMLLILRSCTV